MQILTEEEVQAVSGAGFFLTEGETPDGFFLTEGVPAEAVDGFFLTE